MKTSHLFLLAALLTVPLYAQDDEPGDGPGEPPYSGIFGFGGGIDGLWYFANTAELNTALTARAMPTIAEDGMLLFGGHGYVYVMVIPNFRIGGMGAGGSRVAQTTVDGEYRHTEFATSFGGFTMEYIIPIGAFHIGIGALIGGGGNTLTLTRESSGLKTWDDIPANAGGRAVMENSFFAYQPMLTLEYELGPLGALSLAGGYYGTAGNKWTLNDEFVVDDMPDFKFSNAFVRLQLTFGLFIGE